MTTVRALGIRAQCYIRFRAPIRRRRIHIASGPLKDLEGSIVRIDKRNRNAQIALKLQSRIVKAWLGFELLEKEAAAEVGRFFKGTKGK
jgi:hypothetical protein